LPTSGRESMSAGKYAGKPIQQFENGILVETSPGVVLRLDGEGRAAGRWKDPDPVDLEKAIPLQRTPEAGASNGPDLDAADVRRVIGAAEKARGADFSPLNDGDLPEKMVQISKETGVPVWLMLAQAQNETSFGSGARDGYVPPANVDNATVSDGQAIFDRDGRRAGTGNAHNLFNIRPGGWDGDHISTGGGGDFRAYGSFEDSIRDYANLMKGSLYKGKTLSQVVNTYYPAGDGDNSPDRYLSNIIGFARANGINVDGNTIPIGGPGAAAAPAQAGAIPGAEQAIDFMRNLREGSNKDSQSGTWHYWCLGAVNGAYGHSIPSLGKDNAHLSYEAYAAQGQIHRDQDPPRGAVVFFDWRDSSGANIGHVGISLGDGSYIGTASDGPNATVTRPLQSPNYLGWAYPTGQAPAGAKTPALREKTPAAAGDRLPLDTEKARGTGQAKLDPVAV